MKQATFLLRVSFVVSLLMGLAGCGGSGGGQIAPPPPPPPAITITISPTTASVVAGKTQQFTATVQNTTNTAVTWTLSPALAASGTITSAGLYTAPSAVPNPATVTVTATAVADPTKTAAAVVTVLAPVAVSVSPAAVSLVAGGTQQFTATVTGSANTAVTWTLSPASSAAGTITSAGLYTAPSAVPNPATVTVTATAVADPTKTASAVVTVNPPPPVALTTTAVDPLFTGLDDDSVATAFVRLTLTGTGFAAGQYICIAPPMPYASATVLDSTHIRVIVVYDSHNQRPGRKLIGVSSKTCDQGFPGSAAAFYNEGHSNTLDPTRPSGERFLLNQADGKVIALNNPSLGSFEISIPASGIAYDEATRTIAISFASGNNYSAGGVVIYNALTGLLAGVGGGEYTAAVAVDGNGNGCEAKTRSNAVSGFVIHQTESTLKPAGTEPWAVATAKVGGASVCVVYARGSKTLHVYALPSMLAQGSSLSFPDFTGGGRPAVVALNSGTAAGKVVVFDRASNKLGIATLTSAGPLFDRTVQLDSTAVSRPERLVADEVGARVIVAYANPLDPAKLTTFVGVDVRTGVQTPLSSFSLTAPVGLGLTPAGQLLVCDDHSCGPPLPNN